MQEKPAEASSRMNPRPPEQADFQNFLSSIQGLGPPQTIRVRITGKAACDVNAPYSVVTMDFNSYVKNVLPNEWPHWWPVESLKAGAVAVKMYGWYWIARGGKWSDADVTDSTCDQRFRQGSSNPSTDRAVDATWNFALSREGVLFETRHNNAPSCAPPHCMRQSVSADLARQGQSWEEILGFFYPGSDQGSSSGSFGIIVPVEVATPDAQGKVFHVVEPGQSLWAISDSYDVTIGELEVWNNISKEEKLQVGERLFIPGENTEGYATPTPEGMIIPSTPDPDGIIIHIVQPKQTLSTIAQAYGTTVNRLLALNNIKVDWPLQTGQELIVHPGRITPSPTARPLTPIEKLTPESDGKYYHVVESGQNLSRIADLYEISIFDLLEWNSMDMDANLQPEQKLVLQITPPATVTPTPGPTTASPTQTSTQTATLTPTPTPTEVPRNPPPVEFTPAAAERIEFEWGLFIGLAVGGLVLIGLRFWKKSKPEA